ncbi:MAG: 4-(cytidine 5'-diphospho)-2-C-methyl-D-erythritol kinase [Bacteroidales bacterium]|nr:4-(cytidine 5'-diphospho)-2-C-methyl-D-erythritol kinase [Bacteroidales bacterium]
MNTVVYPYAKVNLGLRVLGRRNDGYHDIDTLFYPVFSLTDILEVVTSNRFSMNYYGTPFRLPKGDVEKELCVKAFRMLQEEYGIPDVEIHLYKRIPVGAGLGGGSSDAAFTLKALNTLFGLGLSDSMLCAYAACLGSDCPFFIYGAPMYGSGRGEVLSPCDEASVLDLKNRYNIEVVNPGIYVNTASAYKVLDSSRNDSSATEGTDVRSIVSRDVSQWKGVLANDFEGPVFGQHHEIAAYKAEMYARGAVYASMSGSGSAVYGIFRK